MSMMMSYLRRIGVAILEVLRTDVPFRLKSLFDYVNYVQMFLKFQSIMNIIAK